jgi:hypothetical protein
MLAIYGVRTNMQCCAWLKRLQSAPVYNALLVMSYQELCHCAHDHHATNMCAVVLIPTPATLHSHYHIQCAEARWYLPVIALAHGWCFQLLIAWCLVQRGPLRLARCRSEALHAHNKMVPLLWIWAVPYLS